MPNEYSLQDRLMHLRMWCFKIWAVIGLLIIGTVIVYLLGLLSNVLIFLGIGLLIAFLAAPMTNVLANHGVPRPLAAIAGLATVLAVAAAFFVLVVPLFLSQATELLRELPGRIESFGRMLMSMQYNHELLADIAPYIEMKSLIAHLQELATSLIGTLLSAIGSGIVPILGNIAQGFFLTFLGLVFSYWLVSDYPAINEEICKILGDKKSKDYRLLVSILARSVGGYLRTTVINAVIQGTLVFLGCTLIGHPYPGVMGVFAAVFNFIPVIGPMTSAATSVLVAAFYSPTTALATVCVMVIAQNITDNLIAPRLNQSTLRVHPAMSLMAIVAGSTLMGTFGMVIAIPLCAIARGLFIFYYESHTKEHLVSYDGALFRGTPYFDSRKRPAPAADALGDPTYASDPDQGVIRAEIEAVAAPRQVTAWQRALDGLIHPHQDIPSQDEDEISEMSSEVSEVSGDVS